VFTNRDIQTLDVFIDNRDHPGTSLPHDTYSGSARFSHLAQLQNLRSLSSNCVVLDLNILELLGGLLRLESLLIYAMSPSEKKAVSLANLNLSKDSFPSLRHFELSDIPFSQARFLCDAPPLMQKLVSTTLMFNSDLPGSSEVMDLIAASARIARNL
jgi:hypothetical protein